MPARYAAALLALVAPLLAQDPRYIAHSLAVEAMLRRLAPADSDRPRWGLAGLLHDIDLPATAAAPSLHGVIAAGILGRFGFDAAVVLAIASHDDRAGIARTSRLDHALYCADQLYWLLRAVRAPSGSNPPAPADRWAQIQAIPGKQVTAAKVASECEAAGLPVPRAIAAAETRLPD